MDGPFEMLFHTTFSSEAQCSLTEQQNSVDVQAYLTLVPTWSQFVLRETQH